MDIADIAALFNTVRLPAVGIVDDNIAFMNTAAFSSFGDLSGDPAKKLFPEHILAEQSDQFTATAVLRNIFYNINAVHYEGLLLVICETADSGDGNELFPAGLSTAMRGALGGIKLSSELISQLTLDVTDPKLQSYLAILEHNYYTLQRLITGFSTVSALRRGNLSFRPEKNDLVQLCFTTCSTVSHFAKPRNITVDFIKSTHKLEMVFDHLLVEQMLLNLLCNSLISTSSGGRVSVDVFCQDKNAIISVVDDGDGLSFEKLSSLFSRFDHDPDLSSLSDGVGLGLAVARGIAERHGGTLIIGTNAGKGCSVRALLRSDIPPDTRFSDAPLPYENMTGMDAVLTELSPFLNADAYTPKYLD